MPYINVHVDLDDIYDDMDGSDKRAMAEWLFDDGVLQKHPNPEIRKMVIDSESLMEEEFQKNLSKLWNNYYSISGEDLLLIEQLSKKY